MNFSHGSHEYHQSVIDNIRKMTKGTFIRMSTYTQEELTAFGQKTLAEDLSLSLWTPCVSIPDLGNPAPNQRLHVRFALQKGPEIRTGLTRDNKDVSFVSHSRFLMD